MRLQRSQSHPTRGREGFGPSSRTGPALLAIPPTVGWHWGWVGLSLGAGITLLALGCLIVMATR
jgi:hypothetical protein